jgi:hypothetical protein
VIIYFGENDPERTAKTNWLKIKYGDSKAISIHSLKRNSLSDNRSFTDRFLDKKETLVISGHGNDERFMDRSPLELYTSLMGAGLNHDRFGSIYLLGCDVGLQFNDRYIATNFMKQFALKIRQGPARKLKVYAPRGEIVWMMDDVIWEHLTFPRVAEARIQICDEDDNVLEDYSFETGMLIFK